jgi:hypothetical protein
MLWRIKKALGMDLRKRCCRDEANRGPTERINETLSFARCKCGLRHFEANLDPAEIRLFGSDAG